MSQDNQQKNMSSFDEKNHPNSHSKEYNSYVDDKYEKLIDDASLTKTRIKSSKGSEKSIYSSKHIRLSMSSKKIT